MDITYCKKIQDNPEIDGFKNRGLSLEKIEKLESKYNKGIKFPISVREFLYLAGEFNNLDFEYDPDLESLQKRAEDELESNQQQIGRPFFAFHSHNDCESFLFIFLDEDEDDPKTYVYQGNFLYNGHELFEHNGYTFKTLAEMHVDNLLKGYSI